MGHDRILVATDGSDPARAATAEAIALAEAFDADLHAVYVLMTAELPPWFEDPELEPGVNTKAGQALTAVTEAASSHGFDRAVETAVMKGDTAPAILTYAADHDIDMIVMGTHGRTGIDRLLMGSVAERVVREAAVPVVTVRPDAD